MKLVDDWKRFWTWFSVQMIALNTTFVVAYDQFQVVKDMVPPKIAHWVIVGLLVAAGVGRVIKQYEDSNAPVSK
jgi:hypothetical protein